MSTKIQFPFFFFVILVTLFSCGTKDGEHYITTANNEKIALQRAEKNIPIEKIDKFSLNRYALWFNSIDQFQIPLNVVISSGDNTFYYGIPVNGTVTDIYEAFGKKYNREKISSFMGDDKKTGKIIWKDSSSYILMEIFITPKNNVLLAGFIATDSTAVSSLYESNRLIKMIKKEE